jgi:predicted Ser/Thr protein kinase
MAKSPKCPDCNHAESRHDAEACKTCGERCPSVYDISPAQADQLDESPPAQYDKNGLIDRTAITAKIPVEIGDALEIGGHEGLHVYRTPDGIVKVAEDVHNEKALANEVRFLELMSDSDFTPQVLAHGPGWMRTEDLGDSDKNPTDGEAFRRNMIRLVYELRKRLIRHGDLTSANMILRGNKPYAIDFQEAHVIGEMAPQKTPFSDSHLALYRTLRDWETSVDAEDKFQAGTADTPRIARRWGAVLGHLGAINGLDLPLKGQRFLDLGCYQGDFVALAAVEGMKAFGIDQGGFRTGANSVEEGREIFGYLPNLQLDVANIMDLDTFTHDVVLMFSTFSYMVKDFGSIEATLKLREIVQDCGVLFFENQLFGDGPGPEFFPTDDAIEAWLKANCYAKSVEKLIEIPVYGRPASRSVFAVRG